IVPPRDPTKLPTREVRALALSRDGTLWAGSQRGGTIAKFDRATQSWRRVQLSSDSYIFNFLELPNGHLVLGRESVATEFNPVTRENRDYSVPGYVPFRASVLARNGNVFFGTHQGGVIEFLPGSGFGRS